MKRFRGEVHYCYVSVIRLGADSDPRAPRFRVPACVLRPQGASRPPGETSGMRHPTNAGGMQMGERRLSERVTTMERLYRAPFPWEIQEAQGEFDMSFDMTTAHVRVVEFIAKPGRNFDLRKCIARDVLPFLALQPGFKNSLMLTPHREPRLVLVFSFWEKELDSRENQWE